MPHQPITSGEGRIGQELLAVPPDLTGGEALAPDRPIRMGVAPGVERDNARVCSADAIAISVATIEGSRQPAFVWSRFNQPGRFRGRNAPIRCGWQCRFW